MIDIATDLDLYDKQTIKINRKATDNSDITSKEAEFTKTFQGPATKRNLAIIDQYGIIEANSSFNPHKGIEAIWTVEDSKRFEGTLEARKIIYGGGVPKSIEFVFYGGRRTLSAIIGADRFVDIDFSAFDHSLTYSNVVNSWDVAGPYLYPLIDTSKNYFYGPEDVNLPGNIANESNPILLTDLRPALNFKLFMQEIFINYGLSLSFDPILDLYLNGLYILPNRNSGSDNNPLVFEDTTSKVTEAEAAVDLVPDDGVQHLISFNGIEADPQGEWGGPPPVSTFNPQVLGFHTFEVFIALLFISPPNVIAGGKLILTITAEVSPGIETVVHTQETNYSGNTNNSQTFINLSVDLNLILDVDYRVRIENQSFDITTGRIVQVQFGTVTVKAPSTAIPQPVAINSQMPDDKVLDWLSQFMRSWNLLLIEDLNNANNYELISQKTYYEQGEVRDWSKNLDIENIAYSKRKVFKEVSLKYKESEAGVQVAYKNAQGRTYGSVNSRPDVDFGEAKLEYENPCTIIPPALFRKVDAQGVPTGENAFLTLHKSIDQEGQPVAEKFLLFYFGGLVNTADPYYLQNSYDPATGAVTALEQNAFPFIGSVQSNGPITTSTTLCYSLESDLFGNIPQDTAYKRFWEQRLLLQYDPTSRKIDNAKLYLTTKQFYEYDLRDEIFIEGIYWNISKISHDTSTGETICTLQSSRTQSVPEPFTTTPGGEIIFDNPAKAGKLQRTALGVYESDGKLFGSFLKVQISPNLNAQQKAKIESSTELNKAINAIGGRLRSWED